MADNRSLRRFEVVYQEQSGVTLLDYIVSNPIMNAREKLGLCKKVIIV